MTDTEDKARCYDQLRLSNGRCIHGHIVTNGVACHCGSDNPAEKCLLEFVPESERIAVTGPWFDQFQVLYETYKAEEEVTE